MDGLDELFPHYDRDGLELVRKAAGIAQAALAGDVRGDGSPFFEHPLGVARIVSDEIGLPAECVAAVFLHEASRFHPDVPLGGFSSDVLTMVDGLNKISSIKPKDTRLEAENYKKLIVQYSRDPRVTVIKIADRLEIMRNLSLFPKADRERKQLETLLLYIPLAHQLGLYNIKGELENIWFKFAEPEQYRLITNKLKAGETDRRRLSEEFIKPLELKLQDAGISYHMKVRTKSAYSIYKKMLVQKVPFEGVYDVFAIRLIIDCDCDLKAERDLCWQVYGYVTEEYEADEKRLRDWVSRPKANGYESLHITVRNRDGAYLEVQIRTRRMDDIAENGHAAHWSYKGIRHEQTLDNWLTSVRWALEHPGEAGSGDLPEPPGKEIFVFTPTGELKILPAGSTVLDFAFRIHSNVGSRCTGAKIGGKAVSIRETLHTGDVVEIMTGRNQKPSPDWLTWVVTSKARSRIKHELSEMEFRKASEGKGLLERRLKNWKLELPDELLAEYMKKKRYTSLNSFYAALGEEALDVNDVKEFILESRKERVQGQEEEVLRDKQWKGGDAGGDDILVLNARDVKGLDYKMARCCNPVLGDDVFGFVTRGKGITIHRMSCPNASRLMDRYPYRIQKVRWADTPTSTGFQCTLRITAEPEYSVISKIMEVTAGFKASVRSFNVNRDNRKSTYEITARILVPSNMELDKVISQVSLLKHVIKVKRI
ncbi:MAG: HD domain-containing protein [Bacteroidia bacterium]|nr:HD domain-containing protein [Bacteroidia bacterium]